MKYKILNQPDNTFGGKVYESLIDGKKLRRHKMEINADLLIQAYSRIAHVSHYHIFIMFIVLEILSGYVKAFITRDLDSKVGLRELSFPF